MHLAFTSVLVVGLTLLAQESQPDRVSTDVAQKKNDSGTARTRSLRSLSAPLGSPGDNSRLQMSNLPEVQVELNLSEEQKLAVSQLTKNLSDKQMQLIEEFQNRLVEVNREFDQSTKKLLDPKQAGRMEQLHLQRVGPVALLSPELVRELALTVDQQSKLQARLRSLAPAASLAFTLPAEGESSEIQTNYSRLTDNQKKVVHELLNTLTPEQRAKWDEKVGAKFNFADSQSSWDRDRASTRGRMSATNLRISLKGRTEPFELGGINRPFEQQMPMAIALRMFGPLGPFRFKSTVDSLTLTQEQASQIQRIAIAHAEAIRKISADPNAEAMERIDVESQRDIDKLLTDDQKKKLAELTRS